MASMLATKSRKTVKAKAFAPARYKSLHTVAPWTCVHVNGRSEIKAYVLAAGGWETIATIRQTAGIDAEATANFIAHVVNDYERMQNLVGELVAALEPCLACDGLSWEAEHGADTALAHARQENQGA